MGGFLISMCIFVVEDSKMDHEGLHLALKLR